ncbi:MAG: hypothetical protein LRY51_01225 [Geovibrio sp.]|nr:hypothetical protein [Geovibrio sp.]
MPELSWPDWCLYPLAAAIAVASRGGRVDLPIVADAQDLACLASWRVTRGVYRFDDWLYGELVKTDIKTDLPMSVFFNLPQHCIYIELRGVPFCGVFVWLEYDVNTQEAELRLAFDDGRSLLHVPLSLVFEQSLEDAVKYALRDAAQNAEKHGIKNS